ncbi:MULTISPECIES: HNH endonuclease [Streptomyces]|uniref:HNH endonuclease n=1 Tax=Streptomyces TaxID=1883 RepID=UPI00131A6064|nr:MULTISPECIES: HNH endonuclease [Streptomyces]
MTRRLLSDAQALWAIKQVHTGTLTQAQVAARLGVPPTVINALVRGRTYKHLHGVSRGARNTDGGKRHGFKETPERRYWREAKFWARVNRSGGPDTCWPWVGGKPGAYGHSGAGQAMTGSAAAHVVAFTLAMGLGQAPNNARVLRHLCDNKPCCNPAHLRPGTVSENLADRWQAHREGRTGPRDVSDPVLPPPGGWRIASGSLDDLDYAARVAEFHARVDASGGPDACWPWTARSRHRFGYGFMRFAGRNTVPAHRIAYVVAHDLVLADIDGLVIMHKCLGDTLRNNCNNPAHLAAGTQADNIIDKNAHGTMPRGEHHHRGKRFPDARIADIRERYWRPTGEQPTITALAREVGASVTGVAYWLNGTVRREAGGPLGPPPQSLQYAESTCDSMSDPMSD